MNNSILKVAVAFGVGASIALVPGFLAAKLFLRPKTKDPQIILRTFYAAIFLKWLLTLLLFAVVFSCFSFDPYALLIGFIAAQGLLPKIVNKTNNNSAP